VKKLKKPSNIIHDVDMLAVSPTEMTGLIASAPRDHNEIEAYKEIMPFMADCDRDKKSK